MCSYFYKLNILLQLTITRVIIILSYLDMKVVKVLKKVFESNVFLICILYFKYVSGDVFCTVFQVHLNIFVHNLGTLHIIVSLFLQPFLAVVQC